MVVVALVGAGGLPFPAVGQSEGSLDLQPDAGQPATSITAVVAGFDDCRPDGGGPVVEDGGPVVEDTDPETGGIDPEVEDDGTGTVAFTWIDGRALGEVRLDADGGAVSPLLIPGDAEPGEATITATCLAEDELSASASFTVVAPPDEQDEVEPPDERPPGDVVEPPGEEVEPDDAVEPGADETDAGEGAPGVGGTDDDVATAAEGVVATDGPWLWIVAVALALVLLALLIGVVRRAGDVRWARRHVRVVAGATPRSSTQVDTDLHRAGTTLTLRLEPRSDPGVSHLEEVP